MSNKMSQITETIAEAPSRCVRVRRVTYVNQPWKGTLYLVQSRALVMDSTEHYFAWKPAFKFHDEAEALDMMDRLYNEQINCAAANAAHRWFREIQTGLYELFEAVGYEGFFQQQQAIGVPLSRKEVTRRYYPGLRF
jgi:hypothetical protein